MAKKALLILGILLIGALIIIVVFVLIPWMNHPVVGTMLNNSVVQDVRNDQLVFDFSPKTMAGVYASFSYPASLITAPNSRLVGPVVEMHNLYYRDVQTWNLAVAIEYIPSENLRDNGSYTYYKSLPAFYDQTSEVINNQTVLIFSDKTVGGFEKAAILVHGPYQATVSLYGDDAGGVDKLASTFSMILESWHWLR